MVELGNNLLKIKNTRFGSIDKESNYLIDTVSKNKGEVLLIRTRKKKNELNRRTQNSTQYAVIVPTNELKTKPGDFLKHP